MFDLRPDLPDDTLMEMVRIPTRIRNALNYAGLKTVGEVRETPDATFASIPDLGPGSIKWLRERVGRAGDRLGTNEKSK
jgi:DNA-directed RNA polymerase alpha subunit